jgi:hypothetical protein
LRLGLQLEIELGAAGADAVRRFRLLQERFENKLPPPDALLRNWQQAVQRWAELVVLRWECDERLNERNPARAGLVERAVDWRWSSL